MCGINGILSFKQNINFSETLLKMNDALSHRGPDDSGFFSEDNIFLGHRRLSIIDLSEAGHQPMTDHSGRFVMVFNGEIYNFREIRKEIESTDPSITFNSGTDTEVLLAAFSLWGKYCLEKLNGMFAFAVWDRQDKKLFLCRDRLGIKPMYYYQDNEKLIFSSEIRPLLGSGLFEKRINYKALADYLRYQTVHAPETIAENVFMLMPGHFAVITEDDTIIEQYWNPIQKALRLTVPTDYSKVCSDIHNLLLKSVELRLVADVPFGAFLSGGIDSSAVVGLMSKVSPQPIKTFTISFEEEEFSEAVYARRVAEKFNTEHHEIKLSANELLKLLPDALAAMDHPSGDGPNTFLVSKVAKENGITMAVSGLGGDELFAGYDIFKRLPKLKDYKWLLSFPKGFRRMVGNLLTMLKPGIASEKIKQVMVSDYFDLSYIYPIDREVLNNEQVYKILKKKKLPANRVSEIVGSELEYGTPGFKLPYLSKISLAEIITYMQNVLLRDTDQMSMAHALEVRVPFLDYKLVEYVLAVQDSFKNPVTPKKLLIDSLGDLLPDEIVNRPKMGFTFPWKHWMKNELRDFCEAHIESFSKRDFADEKEVKKLWKKFMEDDPFVSWSRVWHIIVLENWLKKQGL
jgi:asparagine synthase (glutamine-hydrolysing)